MFGNTESDKRTIILLYDAPVLELGSLDVSMQVVELLLRLVVQSHHLLLERADRLHAAPLQALLLRQLLLELHYDLLDEDESEQLRSAISTDPEVAAEWAATLRWAGKLADAAKIEVAKPQFSKVGPRPPFVAHFWINSETNLCYQQIGLILRKPQQC